MVDIHSHILWGLDDGAKTIEDSLAMLRVAAEAGTTDIVATPHADQDYEFQPEAIQARILDLRSEVSLPRLHSGCDFHLSLKNIQDALTHPRKYTINGGPYLMVEFSDIFIPPTIDQVFRQFVDLGMVPVLTHPERNAVLQRDTKKIRTWIEIGCLVQVTAQSFTDRFGKRAKELCWQLTRENMVHFVASDAHDTVNRPPRLDHARDLIAAEFGAERADLLVEENPRAVIAGQMIWADEMPEPAAPRKWFQFWA